ncbi:unnamed protein product [Notodromas monacha]|uniref:Uncharacterized protein n=1 Tax=Notodromas monacha TaxID=399045 RepID=A0A7R9G865_9CRUS|nr:unnamed protein product [Notodromas monacha]CAG0912952.1 unnamed protein product [Notodromas monacha]
MPAKKLREIVLCAIAMQREQSVILVLGLSENDSQFLGLDDILQPCVMDMLNVVSVSVPLMHSKLLKNDGNLSNQDQDFSSMMFIGPEGLKLVRSIYRNVDHSASLLKERTRLMTLLAMSRRPETALRFIQPKGKECVFSKEDCEVFENLESRKQLPESKIEMGKSLALACAKFDHWMLEWTSAMRIFYRLTIPTQTSATPKSLKDSLRDSKDPLTENNGEKLQRLKADITKKTSFDDLIAVLDSALSDACRLKRKTKQTESPRLQRQERCLKFAIESLEKARDLKKDSSPVTLGCVKEKQLDDIGQMNACLQIRHPVNSYQRQFKESE